MSEKNPTPLDPFERYLKDGDGYNLTMRQAFEIEMARAREQEAEEIAGRLAALTNDCPMCLEHIQWIRQRHTKPGKLTDLSMSDAQLMTKLTDIDEARIREIAQEVALPIAQQLTKACEMIEKLSEARLAHVEWMLRQSKK